MVADCKSWVNRGPGENGIVLVMYAGERCLLEGFLWVFWGRRGGGGFLIRGGNHLAGLGFGYRWTLVRGLGIDEKVAISNSDCLALLFREHVIRIPVKKAFSSKTGGSVDRSSLEGSNTEDPGIA